MRPIVLCADDAGWQVANDAVILGHAIANQISAVSLLVDGLTATDWSRHNIPSSCGLGLHLNLTWSPKVGSHGLSRLIASAYAGSLDQEWLDREIGRQIIRFERVMGRPPDYIDGHQHVHVLPRIRDRLLVHLDKRYRKDELPLVRNPYSQRWRGLKAATLNLLGAARMARELSSRQWPTNPDFAGVYDLSVRTPYRTLMLRWLKDMPAGGVIMCHPGVDALPEHGSARRMESAYLASEDWISDREISDVFMIPFTRETFSTIWR